MAATHKLTTHLFRLDPAKHKVFYCTLAPVMIKMAERHCTGWLSMAENLQKAGKPDQARPYLERIIRDYPDTPFAEKAQAMLAGL